MMTSFKLKLCSAPMKKASASVKKKDVNAEVVKCSRNMSLEKLTFASRMAANKRLSGNYLAKAGGQDGLVELKHVGSSCINYGCTSSKKIAETIRVDAPSTIKVVLTAKTGEKDRTLCSFEKGANHWLFKSNEKILSFIRTPRE